MSTTEEYGVKTMKTKILFTILSIVILSACDQDDKISEYYFSHNGTVGNYVILHGKEIGYKVSSRFKLGKIGSFEVIEYLNLFG